MKKLLLIVSFFTCYLGSFAQTKIDSVALGAPSSGFSYPNDVFYNMKNGAISTVSGHNWHLAFSVRTAAPPFNVMRSTTILANEGRGVKIYESTQSLANWSAFDTTNYNSWSTPHNSDSTWDIGALNAGRNSTDGFDFGWGSYDQITHDLTGTKIFLVKVTIGSGQGAISTFKKIMIEKLAYDTQWVFTYANLDNSELKNIAINKSTYAGKLFAYQNLLTDSTFDREPNGKWDLLFTRYGANATQFGQTIFSTNTGVLSYPTLLTSKVEGTPLDLAVAGTYNSRITNIGADWKINPGPGQPVFTIKDSLTYFTKDINSRIDKLVFKEFRGSASGVIVFNVSNDSLGTGLNNIPNIELVSLYPNPATTTLTVQMSDAKKYAVSIFDLAGKAQINTIIYSNQNTVDISSLNAGIYFVCIENNGAKKTARLIVR